MFRHFGERRTLSHNLQLATLLSFVAGVVNISGVFYIKTLTTNVTGHFAFFCRRNCFDQLWARFHLCSVCSMLSFRIFCVRASNAIDRP